MVNIIIPAYNAHKTIRQAIASVASQENQEQIKLTIVDDCSSEPYNYLLRQHLESGASFPTRFT
jgi:glycosyltransferase involved in cell wall biosynthesis